jgi:hypothetical protein
MRADIAFGNLNKNYVFYDPYAVLKTLGKKNQSILITKVILPEEKSAAAPPCFLKLI